MKTRRWNLLFIVTFIVYLVFLLHVLFSGHENSTTSTINLLPSHSISNNFFGDNRIGGTHLIKVNTWGNVLIFIPTGIYLSSLLGFRKTGKAFLAIVLFSLDMELIQFISPLGIFDVDDILLNTLGRVLVVFIFHLILKWTQSRETTKTFII
ncbi:MAG: VanZ family protein [Lactobacillales bacterium]|jgi:glycopeptide antibiotics resistance protein|nr:VanZ family protein [Lactobacillales bacterium]